VTGTRHGVRKDFRSTPGVGHALVQRIRLRAPSVVEGRRQAQPERGAANQRCLISWDACLEPRAVRGGRRAGSVWSTSCLHALPQIEQQGQNAERSRQPHRLNPSPQWRRAAGLKKRNMPGRSRGGRVHQRGLRGHRRGKRCWRAVQGVAQRELVEQEAVHRRVVRQQRIKQVVRVGWVVVTCCRVIVLGGWGACCRRTGKVLVLAGSCVGKRRRQRKRMHLQRRGMQDLVQAPERGHHHQRHKQPQQSRLRTQLAAGLAVQKRAQPCPADHGLRGGKPCCGGVCMGAVAGHGAGFTLLISQKRGAKDGGGCFTSPARLRPRGSTGRTGRW
jgi:hypothetical protein